MLTLCTFSIDITVMVIGEKLFTSIFLDSLSSSDLMVTYISTVY